MQTTPALRHIKKFSFVKSYHLLATALFAMFFCSCQKDNVTDSVLNSTTSGTSAEARTRHHHGGGGSGGDGGSNGITNYGAMICPPDNMRDNNDKVNFQSDVADEIGISCLRSGTQVPNRFSAPVLKSDYDIVLNFNTSIYTGTPEHFATNLPKYESDLKSTLSHYTTMPVVAVIENEETNRYFYSGTAKQYLDELKVAIDVMHANGIKVANGGITDQGLNYLVYEDFLDQGKNDSAQKFKEQVGVSPTNPDTKDRGDFIDELLSSYRQIDLDYINFHWKAESPNTDALTSVINYLKKRTGKPIMSNEFGHFDGSSNTLNALLQKAADENFPYVLVYSPDENHNKRGDSPLHHSNKSLTNTGIGYRDYLAK